MRNSTFVVRVVDTYTIGTLNMRFFVKVHSYVTPLN